MIDKLGCCPNCKKSWEGQDIKEALSMLSIHQHKSDSEMIKLAAQYGWTPENPTKFTAANIIELKYPLVQFTLLECNNCLHVFDIQSEIEFKNLAEAKRDILTEEEEDQEEILTKNLMAPQEEVNKFKEAISEKIPFVENDEKD